MLSESMAYNRPSAWIICSLFLIQLVIADLKSEYDHAAYLDPEENYKLYWSVKEADKSIHFAAEVKTIGWVGFGISAGLSGNMKGADMVVGWVDSQGKGHLQVNDIYCRWSMIFYTASSRYNMSECVEYFHKVRCYLIRALAIVGYLMNFCLQMKLYPFDNERTRSVKMSMRLFSPSYCYYFMQR